MQIAKKTTYLKKLEEATPSLSIKLYHKIYSKIFFSKNEPFFMTHSLATKISE